MTIKLYMAPGACSLAPHILLYEVAASFTLVRLSVRTGFPADFAKINPKMRVPVLDLDGEIITEVPAILTAIAQLAPDRKLLGRRDLDAVRAYEWMNWLSGTLHGQGFGGLWRPQRFVDENQGLYKKIREKGRRTVEECFEGLEGRLKGEHAVGEEFSVVDVYLYVFWRWGCEIGVNMVGRFPRFAALARRVSEREAAREALREEGVEAYAEGRVKI
jgi:glutathione S-transferase